jgi:hypothetical protein
MPSRHRSDPVFDSSRVRHTPAVKHTAGLEGRGLEDVDTEPQLKRDGLLRSGY